MATNKDRGTKRTCQNGECGARFYDLNRSPIVCPICGSKYAIAHSTTAAAAVAPQEKAPRKVKREEFVEPAAAAEVEAEEALVDVEADETEDAAAGEADETFLEEEEEDGGDVSNIIGGPVEGEEER